MGLPAELQELLAPRAYPHPVEHVQLVETPISWVLLTGPCAYKIKRPVRLEYLDQHTPQRRAELCAEELRLNRRFAPELYLGVRTIRRDADGLRVTADGAGVLVEHAVCMRQFDRSQELDRLIASDDVSPEELADFGGRLAALHAGLEPAAPGAPWGTAERVRALVIANLEQCAHAAGAQGTHAEVVALRTALERLLDEQAPLLAQRRAAGRIRECHGDLHTRNIVRLDGRLLAFDCVEFEPAFRWIDVADDLAFLIADLETLRVSRLAWACLQAYLESSGDWQACRLLPLYQAHRALVRAKVAALSAAEDRASADALRRTHRDYLAHAARMLRPARPGVLLMSGLSGSGKTWLAARLAPELGMLHLRSDIERKRAAGLAARQSSGSGLQRGLYTPAASAALYRELRADAADIVAGGAADRRLWRAWAAERALPLCLVHCAAPERVLRERIAQRRATARDASEADLAVLAWQQQIAEPFTEEERATLIEADTTRADVLATVLRGVRGALAPAS
jgi:aminoglycoside phosphotransferase family enzyme/predicted kinase